MPFAAPPRSVPPRAGCLLVNTTGELRAWYELATVVFIGKSLSHAATGGQNPVEPVFAGKPVLFGPHMENFRAVVTRLVGGDAGIDAPDEKALEAAIAALLRDPARREYNRLASSRTALHQDDGLLLIVISASHQTLAPN